MLKICMSQNETEKIQRTEKPKQPKKPANNQANNQPTLGGWEFFSFLVICGFFFFHWDAKKHWWLCAWDSGEQKLLWFFWSFSRWDRYTVRMGGQVKDGVGGSCSLSCSLGVGRRWPNGRLLWEEYTGTTGVSPEGPITICWCGPRILNFVSSCPARSRVTAVLPHTVFFGTPLDFLL